MSYEPTIWETGDVITAEKLNKIEQAIYALYGGGGGNVIVAPEQTITVGGFETEQIEVSPNYEVPDNLPTNWKVEVNGTTLMYLYAGGAWNYTYPDENDNQDYYVFINASGIAFQSNIDDSMTVTVKITELAEGELPEGYTVVAPEQSVVFEDSPADITFVSGYTISSPYPSDWLAIVDNHELTWDSTYEYYTTTVDGVTYSVGFQPDAETGDVYAELYVFENSVEKYGTYTVTIYAPEDSGGGEK